jgi:4-amino-4-deoxy-L-arabinose transferase-like glycosyltransferase
MSRLSPLTAAAGAAIVLVTAILVFHRIGAADVCGGNEGVEAVFVQQMVEHGHILFPLENRRQPMYKPPLFHWTALAIDRALGIDKVTAGNLRAPSALYAIAGVAMTMAMALWLLGAEGAILAGLTLAGSYQYISLGRFGRVDMTLAFFESAALFLFLIWLPPGRAQSARAGGGAPAHRAILYLLAIAMGLAVLAKGPVGALVPGAAMLAFMAIERRWPQLLAMLEPGPLIAGALIASSWYAACYIGGRFGFLDRQLGSENVGRFFGELGRMAPWYYVKPLLLNSAPMSLLVPIAVFAALRTPGADDEIDREPGDDLRARTAIRVLAIFWIVTVIFFSIAAYKRRAYLLPLWPAAALMLAWWLLRLQRLRFGIAAVAAYGAACGAVIVFNFFYIPHHELRECAGYSYRPAAAEIAREVGPSEPLYTYGFHEELAPLLFYLDRDAPALHGKLGDAPPGYIIVPANVWRTQRADALDLQPVLTSDHGHRRLVLLRRGKALASARESLSAPARKALHKFAGGQGRPPH